MISILYSKSVIAFPGREMTPATSIHVVPFETFGTEYGMFIPISSTGYQFLRWIKKGMTDPLAKNNFYCWLLHVSNDGEVLVVIADTETDMITCTPYCSEKFSLLNGDRDVSEAYNALMAKCTNISQAVDILDNGTLEGMYDPFIILVEDWVAHAKSKGWNKTFYRTHFSDKNPV